MTVASNTPAVPDPSLPASLQPKIPKWDSTVSAWTSDAEALEKLPARTIISAEQYTVLANKAGIAAALIKEADDDLDELISDAYKQHKKLCALRTKYQDGPLRFKTIVAKLLGAYDAHQNDLAAEDARRQTIIDQALAEEAAMETAVELVKKADETGDEGYRREAERVIENPIPATKPAEVKDFKLVPKVGNVTHVPPVPVASVANLEELILAVAITILEQRKEPADRDPTLPYVPTHVLQVNETFLKTQTKQDGLKLRYPGVTVQMVTQNARIGAK